MVKLKEGFSLFVSSTEAYGEVGVGIYCGVPQLEAANRAGKSVKVVVPTAVSKFPGKGYIFAEGKVFEILQKAAEAGQRVIVRFEKQRKKGVDINIPLAEITKTLDIARDNVIHACTGVYYPKEEKWILSDSKADPALDTPESKQKIREFIAGEQEDIDTEDFFDPPAPPQVKVANPPSFDKQQQLITMYYFILGCEKKYKYTLEEGQRRSAANDLLVLANAIQKFIKKADVVDYRDYSHTRARYLIFTFEDLVLNLDINQIAKFNEWKKQAWESAVSVLDWAQQPEN